MTDTSKIQEVRAVLTERLNTLKNKQDILKSVELKALYEELKGLPAEDKGAYGKAVNDLRMELTTAAQAGLAEANELPFIDVTAPFDANVKQKPRPLGPEAGSVHPLMKEQDLIIDIFNRMGFVTIESRQIDDDYHMFESLNFPADHPARDDYDTFTTTEGFIAPAHTSTMQNRVLKMYKENLAKGEPIAVLYPGRVYRNEDIDVTHEHTFYQYEGMVVGKGINVGNLIATLRAFMSEYFGQELKAKLQPFYFPFTEPSFEFAIERPEILRKGDTEADMWLELLGCGMVHPNVLKMAGVDPEVYSGFAWGGGLERLVLMKYGIEDIRHFEAAKLDFLRQFS
ncbi:MAG: pheS [Candidatus Saccharibacteria bacterium]|nr:pheS [Candidatus Saccharibacteria bacterium]